MTIDAVVLDIGNVLIEWNPERFYDARLGPQACRRFFAETDIHAMNLELDRGAHFHDTVAGLAARHPRWRDDIMCWHDHWLDLASPAIDHSVRMMRVLQARGIPVFALSNFGIGTFEIACRAYPFLTSFDRSYISGHMGVIKPEPEIYAALETECGIAPDRLLFTDDRSENIEAARQRGWQTHLFDGPAGWAQRLIKAGLLNETEAQ